MRVPGRWDAMVPASQPCTRPALASLSVVACGIQLEAPRGPHHCVPFAGSRVIVVMGPIGLVDWC